MKLSTGTIRNLLLGVVVSAAMVFGVAQAIATDGATPGMQTESCSAFACKKECAPFGGDLGPGGPGQPLQCYCCG